MISLTIETSNAAFADDMHFEVSRIISEASEKIVDGRFSAGDSIALRDVNGNLVGSLIECDDVPSFGTEKDQYVLSFSTDNAAFSGSAKYDECFEILNQAAGQIRRGELNFKLQDVNGNTVGSVARLTAKVEVEETPAPSAGDKYIVNPEKDFVTITRISDGASLFMQGDDASRFLDEVDYIEDVALRNYAISQYDEQFAFEKPQEVAAPVKSLYSSLKEAGIEVGSHESDLYAPYTAEVKAILEQYPLQKSNATVFKSAIDGKMNYDIPFAFEPFWEKASLRAAENIAKEKGDFSVADPAQDKTHSGKVLGVTDSHVVLSLGRSALVVEKRDIDRVPAVEENVTLRFEGGRGVFQPPKSLDLGR